MNTFIYNNNIIEMNNSLVESGESAAEAYLINIKGNTIQPATIELQRVRHPRG